MAEAIVSVLMHQLVSITQLELEQEMKLINGVEKQVKTLSTTLNFIKALLEDAEEKQLTSAAVKLWLEDLKEIMYKVEDILDEWFTKISISQSHNQDKVRSYLSSLCSCFQPLFGRHEIAIRMVEITERLEKHGQSVDKLNLIEKHGNQEYFSSPPTSSVVGELNILGRDSDKEYLVKRLVEGMGESSQSQGFESLIPVVSIVGMGGLGKTTLAQLIYNEIKSKFELSMWVCVSHPFNLEKVAKDIIEQGGGSGQNTVSWEILHQRLCSSVKGKRFMLVLDDVWSEDEKDWTPLMVALGNGAKGSMVLVTTRSEKVANMMESSIVHRLGCLSDHDSWLLFWMIISSGRSQDELLMFEEVGKKLVKKCKGLPLAIKTLASLMRLKRSIQDWRNVLVSDLWEVRPVQEKLLPALLLSYYSLPPHLKRCFVYTSIFPKDTRIPKDILVKFWMAQGLLGSDGSKELEMLGAEYFEDLAMMSFFQDFQKDHDGNIVECKMHDLVHDLACFFNGKGFRHFDKRKEVSALTFESEDLRSLIVKPSEQALSKLLHQFMHLRVLSLSVSFLQELPKEVKRLLHLRFLDLSGNSALKELPEEICDLYNLQTLKLNRCSHFYKLPEGIGKLCNLRHVEVESTDELIHFPPSIGRLYQLRTLCKFPVSHVIKRCGIEELENLDHLKGKLVVTGLRHVRNVHEAKRAELAKKKNISSLELGFGYFPDENDDEYVKEEDVKRMEGVLEGLQPNKNLAVFVITCFPGIRFPLWMSKNSLLSNVVTLQLEKCKKCVQLPALGNMESLERLYIHGLKSLEQIGVEFYGIGVEGTSFPKLKTLSFIHMESWQNWKIPFSNFKNVMPCLSELEIESCPNLMVLPSLGRLKSLEEIKLGTLPLKYIGVEFLGMSFGGVGEAEGKISGDYDVSESTRIVFPSLSKLVFQEMEGWEVWDSPLLSHHQGHNVELMPHLRELVITECPKLKALPADLVKLQSLEQLQLWDLNSLKHVSWGNLTGNGESSTSVILFPKLTILKLGNLPEWEETIVTSATIQIMPNLEVLEISNCPNVKIVPHYMLSSSLKDLHLSYCPQLTQGMQPCLPLLLEKLTLKEDVGAVSQSLLSFSTTDSNNSYPKLKSISIWLSPHKSLPQGLNIFTSLQELEINQCEFLDLKPAEELRQFPMLQELRIIKCPILKERCRREDWNSLSNISYRVIIDLEVITKRC